MKEKELLEILSQNIKFYRKGKFTQETLAEKIGVSVQNINNVEGKRRFPRTENLIKIADDIEFRIRILQKNIRCYLFIVFDYVIVKCKT